MKILVLCHTSEVEDVKKVFPPGKFDVHNLDYQPADAQIKLQKCMAVSPKNSQTIIPNWFIVGFSGFMYPT